MPTNLMIQQYLVLLTVYFLDLYIIKPSHKSTLSNRYVYMTKQMRILTALGNILSFRSHSLSHCRIYQHLHRAYKG